MSGCNGNCAQGRTCDCSVARLDGHETLAIFAVGVAGLLFLALAGLLLWMLL